MEENPMRKASMYKGYLLEYTGVPDEKNPIGLIWSRENDCYWILISSSISRFLIDMIAEAIINEDNEVIEDILEQSGLGEKKPRLSAKLELELSDIMAETKF